MFLEQKRILPLTFILISFDLHNVLKYFTLDSSSVSQCHHDTPRFRVQSPVRAHARINQWNHTEVKQQINVSLFPFLFFPDQFFKMSESLKVRNACSALLQSPLPPIHTGLIHSFTSPNTYFHLYFRPLTYKNRQILSSENLITISFENCTVKKILADELYTIKCFCNGTRYLPIKWQQYWDWWCLQHTVPYSIKKGGELQA